MYYLLIALLFSYFAVSYSHFEMCISVIVSEPQWINCQWNKLYFQSVAGTITLCTTATLVDFVKKLCRVRLIFPFEHHTQKCLVTSKAPVSQVTRMLLFGLRPFLFHLEFMDMSERVILWCSDLLHFYIQHKMGCKLRGFPAGRAWWRSRWPGCRRCGGLYGIISWQ